MVRRVSAAQLAQWFGVSVRQARRWRAGAPVPRAVEIALVVLLSADLGSVYPAWRGWCLSGEHLSYAPSGLTYSPDQLHARPWFEALARQAHRNAEAVQRHPLGLDTSEQAAVAATEAALSRVQVEIDTALALLGRYTPGGAVRRSGG